MPADPAGRFPEGGTLDRLDKSFSRPFFHCVLPTSFELLLTIPAGWFGCPAYAMGLMPLVMAATARQTSRFRALLAGMVALSGGAWFKLCYDSCTQGSGLIKAFTFLSFGRVMVLPHGAMALLSLGSSEGLSAAALYTSSWFAAQLLAEAFKSLSWRKRPLMALQSELESVQRAVPDFKSLVKHSSQANASFPSGDAAGSAVFCSALVLTTGSYHVPASVLLLLTAVGRMYFHCHHLFDVLAGSALGLGVTLTLSRAGRLGWSHVLLLQLCLAGLWKPVQRLKPQGGRESSDALKHEDGSEPQKGVNEDVGDQ